MRYSNYREIARKVANLENFKGNSMSGFWLDSTQYVVFSYSTEIARHDLATGRTGVTDRKFSSTTSRQQNLVRKAWGIK